MKIAGLAKSSTVDYPGLLSVVIFTPGCNLDCFFCHNRSLLTNEVPTLDLAEVMHFLERRRNLLDGVVISGGEPALQSGLAELIAEIRHLGYKVKLDSNGTQPQVLRVLLENHLLDYVAIDFKAPWSRYPEICGSDKQASGAISRSIQLLFEMADRSAVAWEVRTTVIPQLSEYDLHQMAGSLPVLPRYYLQRYIKPNLYRPEDRFRLDAVALTPARLVLLADELRQYQPNIQIR
ncbi:MAG TPA: anaerobic ribonucleoside-triphosphate reductase activating protein [Clostridiales bacterium]|nr:anaerobic ribonucleoside-triphosphate reductase activating protein [Clostridiales bacterium]